jgi:hypothetical protein
MIYLKRGSFKNCFWDGFVASLVFRGETRIEFYSKEGKRSCHALHKVLGQMVEDFPPTNPLYRILIDIRNECSPSNCGAFDGIGHQLISQCCLSGRVRWSDFGGGVLLLEMQEGIAQSVLGRFSQEERGILDRAACAFCEGAELQSRTPSGVAR